MLFRSEASSQTIAVESLIALVIIFAFEKRDVAVFDVPGAYLQADLPDDKFALLKFEGQFVDIMVEVNPDFADSKWEKGFVLQNIESAIWDVGISITMVQFIL